MLLRLPYRPGQVIMPHRALYRCDRTGCPKTFSRKRSKQRGPHDYCGRQCAALHRQELARQALLTHTVPA